MAKHGMVSQRELAALINDATGLSEADESAGRGKAEEALWARFRKLIARVNAGATVQPGFYRVIERQTMGHTVGTGIVDETYQPVPWEQIIELGAPAAREMGARRRAPRHQLRQEAAGKGKGKVAQKGVSWLPLEDSSR